MSTQFRRTAAGFGLALSLALFATPAVHAVRPAQAPTRAVTAGHPAGRGLLSAMWSFLAGTNPFGPKPTQGPTVDPNGIS
jgi:hypothetical protein